MWPEELLCIYIWSNCQFLDYVLNLVFKQLSTLITMMMSQYFLYSSSSSYYYYCYYYYYFREKIISNVNHGAKWWGHGRLVYIFYGLADGWKFVVYVVFDLINFNICDYEDIYLWKQLICQLLSYHVPKFFDLVKLVLHLRVVLILQFYL